MKIRHLNTSKLYFFYILIALLHSNIFAQDATGTSFEQDKGSIYAEEVLPVPAPLFTNETFPLPDKDSVKLRLKKLGKGMDIPLTYNNTIYSFIHYFTVRNRDYSRMVLKRKDVYFPIFERILKENNMPDELKYLSIVESGLNPRARSRAGAVGLWQFVPATGESLDLKIDYYFDDRQDPEKSTRAACAYLKYLYSKFGQWELALAAYNCGPTATMRAVKQSRSRRDFWDVYYHLPRETRSYVPQFIAIAYMINHANDHNLMPDYYENIAEHNIIYTDQYINLEVLARQLEICVEDIQKLNPILTKNVVPAYCKNFPLKIPAEKYAILMEKYCAIMDSCLKSGNEELINEINPFSEKASTRASFTHVVKRGEILNKIAVKYKVSLKELKNWNNLSNPALRYGQKLVIWKEGYQKNEDKKLLIANKKHKSLKTKKTYYVQPGDTLWGISQKADIPISKLKKLNKLKGNEVKPGQKLMLA